MATKETVVLAIAPVTNAVVLKMSWLPPVYGVKFVMLHIFMITTLFSTLYNVHGMNSTQGINSTDYSNFTTMTTVPLPMTTQGPSMEVRLINGPKPNIGRVSIRLSVNDSWIPVCSKTDSDLNVDDSWDQKEINVVCKNLGYNGGWFKEYGRTNVQEQFIAYVKCDGNETNIGECNLYDSPYDTGLGCGNSQYAGAQCYTKSYQPGYLGCFADSTLRVLPDHPSTGPTIGHKWISPNMSISLCVESCGTLNLRYAGLEARDQCFCGAETRKYDKYGRIADSSCSLSCAGNSDEDCGGEYLLSVYDVPKAISSGKCRDPGPPENGFRSNQNITRAETVDPTPTIHNNATNITTGNITSQNRTGNYSSSLSTTSPTLGSTTPPSTTTPMPQSTTTPTEQSNITFYFHSIVYFACEDGYELDGVTSLECVIGSTPDEVKWNGEIPICFLPTTLAPTTTPMITTTTAPPTTTQPTTTITTTLPPLPTIKPAKSTGAGPLVGVVLACLLFLILFLVAVHFYIKKRKQKAATQPISTPREPRVDEEAGLAANMHELEMEAHSNGTNDSAVLDTNEGRFEEEIDLNNVPESHAATDENANDAWVAERGGAAANETESSNHNDNNGAAVHNVDYANEDEYEYEYVDDDDDEEGYEYEYVYENEGANEADGYDNNHTGEVGHDNVHARSNDGRH